MTSDLELLGKFARENSQDAFSELVRRHVDLVYSAALRQVRSPQLAEEVAQSVFADLARSAIKLKANTVLTAWLYAVTRRTTIDAIRKESRRRLREQIAVEMNTMNASANDWPQIETLLDDAMAALDGMDRSAVLLRYFENKSLREVGEALGASEDAAQKRVSRAVERLRDFFSKRNVAVGAGGLAALISANAVQSAPLGLVAAISASTVLAGTAVSTSTAIAATKTIAMTALQKTIIGAALVATVGTAVFEAHQAARLRSQVQTLQQEQAPLAEEIRQLRRERDDATNQLAGLLAENQQLQSDQKEAELLRLRGEVGTLRQQGNRLQRENQNLLSRIAVEPDSTNQVSAEDRFILQQTHANDAMATLLTAVKKFVTESNGHYPANFDQLIASGDLTTTNFAGNIGLSDFEFEKDGTVDPQTNKIILMLRVPIQRPGGSPVTILGCIDSNSAVHSDTISVSYMSPHPTVP